MVDEEEEGEQREKEEYGTVQVKSATDVLLDKQLDHGIVEIRLNPARNVYYHKEILLQSQRGVLGR